MNKETDLGSPAFGQQSYLHGWTYNFSGPTIVNYNNLTWPVSWGKAVLPPQTWYTASALQFLEEVEVNDSKSLAGHSFTHTCISSMGVFIPKPLSGGPSAKVFLQCLCQNLLMEVGELFLDSNSIFSTFPLQAPSSCPPLVPRSRKLQELFGQGSLDSEKSSKSVLIRLTLDQHDIPWEENRTRALALAWVLHLAYALTGRD